MDLLPHLEVTVSRTVAKSLTMLFPPNRNPDMTDEALAGCDTIYYYLLTGRHAASDLLLEVALVAIAKHFQRSNYCPLPCTEASKPFQRLMKVWETAKARREDVQALGLVDFAWRPFVGLSEVVQQMELERSGRVKFPQPRITAFVWASQEEVAAVHAPA
jgi:hypothetical protein